MATFAIADARAEVKPAQLAAFDKAIADAEAEGKEVYSVFISGGVPIMYSIREKS